MALYVVTGGYGFIGRALVSRLKRDGHSVIIASRAQHRSDANDDWVEFNFNDRSTVNNITNIRPDGVFHLAWSTTPGTAEADPVADVTINLAGTIALLDSLRFVSDVPIVLISSGGAIYGRTDVEKISELHPLNPISVYGTTKLAMERYALSCQRMQALDIRVARISNPFGAGQAPARQQGAATIFARKILRGEKIEIWGDGSVVRDYVDVDDVASGLTAIMALEAENLDPYPVFNIGAGQGLSLVDLVEHLEMAAGVRADLTFSDRRVFDIPNNILDVEKLQVTTEWKPRDVREGLTALVRSLSCNTER
ncbi:NAD-dependent epimerase/dehydratase family protein [uncultured Brevundimonas sp.]|uniref:NAD-dependent epimerase/dehydratase family protein n=1 Tax=uncultured Brevundimonas sp. TaxID=213418 RepID=UPI0025F3AB99|nr:NAD-dependent epimerase/dehydratase family protein [uncultured Brevundimonas sp.]